MKTRIILIGVFFVLVLGIIYPGRNILALSWQVQTVDDTGSVGQYTSMVLDSSGYPHISYLESTSSEQVAYNLKYAAWDGSLWQIQTVDNEAKFWKRTSIVLDSLSRPHIAYFDNTDSNLKYAFWDGTSWQKTVVDSVGDVGGSPSMAIDSANHLYVCYLDYANGDLKYAFWNGISWQIETVDSVGYVGSYAVLALDSLNLPHISYMDYTNRDLKYASWNGVSWQIQAVDATGDVGWFNSLAFDSSDSPHISYVDNLDLSLKYTYWDGTKWQLEALNVFVAGDTSLSLDSLGFPHISYYSTLHTLEYIYWNGLAWQKETVDGSSDVGQDNFLVVDSNDKVHISYYDTTNSALKYALGTLTSEEKKQMEKVRAEQNLEQGEKIYLNSYLAGQSIEGQDLKIYFKKLPKKITSNNKYWMKWERNDKYPKKWRGNKKRALKRFWKINTNLNKYKKDDFKIEIKFNYSKKLFKKLRKINSGSKENGLFLEYRSAQSGFGFITTIWNKAKIERNVKNNKFVVKYFYKFPKKIYFFGIGLR